MCKVMICYSLVFFYFSYLLHHLAMAPAYLFIYWSTFSLLLLCFISTLDDSEVTSKWPEDAYGNYQAKVSCVRVRIIAV